MKKSFTCTLVIFLSFVLPGHAQNDPGHNGALAFELGASINYYEGLPDINFGKYDNNRLNWQINGMLGITLARDRAERRTMLAAFGTFGFNNSNTITQYLSDQQYTSTALSQASTNNFYQLEGGFLIADFLRISTGVGQQNFNSQALFSSNGVALNTTYLKYNSTTIGVKLNLGVIAWTINCNIAYGQDFNKTVITPNSGLVLRF